ncbi:hypothetical protein I4U23_021263 [Adineta vaga]|nr:hypothetical protein I4U23_021263 [Adineta vaga]
MDDSNSEGIVQVDLNFHDIQHRIAVGTSRYTLRATINHKADHFTTTIIDSTNRLYFLQ